LLYRSLQAISCNIEYSLQSFFPIIIPLINNLTKYEYVAINYTIILLLVFWQMFQINTNA